ncbi:TBC16 protein, partial [Atractosteus spatula]|nr:TBC16 protein [Atractosteus spatula]
MSLGRLLRRASSKASDLLTFNPGSGGSRAVLDGEIIFSKNNVCVHPTEPLPGLAEHHPGYLCVHLEKDETLGTTLTLTWVPNSRIQRQDEEALRYVTPESSPVRRAPRCRARQPHSHPPRPPEEGGGGGEDEGSCDLSADEASRDSTLGSDSDTFSSPFCLSPVSEALGESSSSVFLDNESSFSFPMARGLEEAVQRAPEAGEIQTPPDINDTQTHTQLFHSQDKTCLAPEPKGAIITGSDQEAELEGQKATEVQLSEVGLSCWTGGAGQCVLLEGSGSSSLCPSGLSRDVGLPLERREQDRSLVCEEDTVTPLMISGAETADSVRGGTFMSTAVVQQGMVSLIVAAVEDMCDDSMTHSASSASSLDSHAPSLENSQSQSVRWEEQQKVLALEQLCGVFRVDLGHMRSLRLFFSDEACTSGQLVIASRESQYKILHFHHGGLDKLAEVFQQWKCCRETQMKDQGADEKTCMQFSIRRPTLPSTETHPEERLYRRLDVATWLRHLNESGQVEEEYKLRKVWPFLLRYYSCDSTSQEREAWRVQKRAEYQEIQQRRLSMSPEEHSEFWRKVQFTVDKDVVRTDRSNSFFRGDNNPNVEIMR